MMITMNRLATPTKNRRRKKNDHDVQGEIETSNGTIKMNSLRKKSVMVTIRQRIAADGNDDDVQVTNLATTKIASIANGTMTSEMIARDHVVEVDTAVEDVVGAAVTVDAVEAEAAHEDVDHTVVALAEVDAAADAVAVMTLKSKGSFACDHKQKIPQKIFSYLKKS
jgi:predicted GNAT family acetyltransferase